jgi:hypothetical protein
MDVIDDTYALIRLKTAHIRIEVVHLLTLLSAHLLTN